MIPYLINNISVQVPSSWDDLSFNQWAQIAKVTTNDRIKVASICLGLCESDMRKARLENVETLYSTLEFINEPCEMITEPVKVKEWDIPKDITFQSLGQFEDMRQTFDKALAQVIKTPEGTIDILQTIPAIAEYFPLWCAIYCQKVRDGEYDYEKASFLSEELKEASCIEVLSAGSFFFYKLTTLFAPTRPSSRKPLPQ